MFHNAQKKKKKQVFILKATRGKGTAPQRRRRALYPEQAPLLLQCVSVNRCGWAALAHGTFKFEREYAELEKKKLISAKFWIRDCGKRYYWHHKIIDENNAPTGFRSVSVNYANWKCMIS